MIVPDWDAIAASVVGTCDSPGLISERFDVPEDEVEGRLGQLRVETCSVCGWWFREPLIASLPDDPTCQECLEDRR